MAFWTRNLPHAHATTLINHMAARPFDPPCQVEVHSLNGRPDLNGKSGRADSFDADSCRYYVTLENGETVALKAANLRQVAARGGAANLPNAGALVEPRLIAAGAMAVLVLFLNWSIITAGLLVGSGLLLHSASQQEGGIKLAAQNFARRLADLIARVTGARVTSAQAVFLLVAIALLLWRFMGGSLSSGGSASSSGWSSSRSSYGSSSYDHRRRAYDRGGGYDGGYGDYGGGGGGFLGLGAGVDLSFLLGAAMLGNMVYRLGGGGRPGGWTIGNFIRGVQNMDFFQLMMFVNLVQNVLGGGRRRGYGGYGGFGRRGMYY